MKYFSLGSVYFKRCSYRLLDAANFAAPEFQIKNENKKFFSKICNPWKFEKLVYWELIWNFILPNILEIDKTNDFCIYFFFLIDGLFDCHFFVLQLLLTYFFFVNCKRLINKWKKKYFSSIFIFIFLFQSIQSYIIEEKW